MTSVTIALDPASSAPARAPRCRLLDRHLNRCPNPLLSEDGIALCAKHLSQAARDFVAFVRAGDEVDLSEFPPVVGIGAAGS